MSYSWKPYAFFSPKRLSYKDKPLNLSVYYVTDLDFHFCPEGPKVTKVTSLSVALCSHPGVIGTDIMPWVQNHRRPTVPTLCRPGLSISTLHIPLGSGGF